jgi:hypothetical protein
MFSQKGGGERKQPGLCGPFARPALALLLLTIAAGLVACGSGPAGTTNPASPTPTPTPTAAAHLQKCGVVQTRPRGEPADPASARQAADCFWRAFRQCHLASLVYSASGVDTFAVHTFTIQNRGAQCAVVDVMTRQVVPQPPTVARSYTCGGVSQQAYGLRFTACGPEGDIVVPTAAVTK